MFRITSFFLALFVFLSSCRQNDKQILATTPAFDSVIAKADHLHDAGNKNDALQIVLQAHHDIENLTLADEMHYYTYCNIVYGNRKNYDKCIELTDSMLMRLNREEDNNKYIAGWRTVAYNAKADALFAKGLYNDAYDYYYKAQKIAQDNADSCSLRSYAYSLAMVLYRQQRFQEAANYFIEAYNESGPCPEDFNLFYFKQEILDNIGLCYNALKQYDSAMLYYNKALKYLDDSKGKYTNKQPSVFEAPKAVVYGNMAEVYVNKGNYDSAKVLYNKSIRINLQKGYTNTDALIDQAKLAALYSKTADVALMKKTLEDIKAEFDTITDARVEISWNKLMWEYYEHQQDPVNAYQYLKNYLTLNDAYINANKSLMTTDVETRVKDIEKQYKINLLTRDQLQQKRYLFIVTVIALMALAIVALVWRNALKSQKNVKLLTALNDMVNDQKSRLELALQALKAKEKDKARILKSVAHDVMNPIAAIVSLTDILSKESSDYSVSQKELMKLITEACNSSLKLSNDILEASEEIDGMNMPKESTDITALLNNCIELLSYSAMAKHQHIKVIAPAGHIYADVYKEKIWRILNNLIANAIKFSHHNTTVTITLERVDNNVHIAVKDEGIGISDKNKPFIFDMFTDAKRLGTSGETPHGLGLSISLQIARAHNGDIWFESKEGAGSTFHLTLPTGLSGERAA